MDNQKIIRKIRGLLAIAQDEKNDEESQSAFMLAQKLMLQYGLDASELTGQSRSDEVIQEEPVTVYKRLYWWERYLAQIISQNFRVKYFMNTKTIGKQAKRQIVFYGLAKDLELAKEMYRLAYEVLLFHSRTFVNQYYQTHTKQARNRYVTESLKTSYLRGFLSGLDERFIEQVAQLRESYELLVLIPEAVEEAYRVLSSQWGKARILQAPNVNVMAAYQEGYQTGKQIDFTKRTLKES